MISLKLSVRDSIFTTMKIYRSTSQGTLYSGAPIFSGALAAQYDDSTALFNVIYYYGVDFITAGGDYVRVDLPAQISKNIYGPGGSLINGNTNFAHMDILAAGAADVPAWSSFLSAYQSAALNGTTGISVANTNATTVKFMYNGEIYYMPTDGGFYAAVGNSAFNTAALKIEDNLAGISSYDINSYRYKPEILKKTMYDAGAWGYFTVSNSLLNSSDADFRPSGAYTYTRAYPATLDDSATRKVQIVNTSSGTVIKQPLIDTNASTTYIAMAFKLLQS